MRVRAAKPALVAAMAATIVAGCGLVTSGGTTRVGAAPYTIGSGTVTTQTRDVASFHQVSASHGVTVHLRQGSTVSVRVTTDDNLQPQVLTTVVGGTLTVTVDGSLETHNRLLVEATTPDLLDSVSAVSGTTVELSDLDAASIAVTVDSGSTLRGAGKATLLSLTVGSGSTADLRDVQAVTARVAIDSGSTASVTVSGLVDGTCTAGSTLHVYGHPTTMSVNADSGSTVKSE